MSTTESVAADEGLLIATFALGEAAFGIDALQIQEVARVGEITPVHNAPADVIGIRNLRGRIVTVIDLRSRLGLGSVVRSPANRVLIVDGRGEPTGLLVDSVADTIACGHAQVAPAPAHLHGVHSRKLRGVCRSEKRLVALLDLGPVLQTSRPSLAANGSPA